VKRQLTGELRAALVLVVVSAFNWEQLSFISSTNTLKPQRNFSCKDGRLKVASNRTSPMCIINS
jgi:thiamine pyrophosphokinase